MCLNFVISDASQEVLPPFPGRQGEGGAALHHDGSSARALLWHCCTYVANCYFNEGFLLVVEGVNFFFYMFGYVMIVVVFI